MAKKNSTITYHNNIFCFASNIIQWHTGLPYNIQPTIILVLSIFAKSWKLITLSD